MNAEPALRILSLGAGRQSTAICLAIAEGLLPKPDYAIFADTGSEPGAVYEHLNRLEREVLKPAGVPLLRVSRGVLHEDVLNPDVYATIPAFTLRLVERVRGFLRETDDPKHAKTLAAAVAE